MQALDNLGTIPFPKLARFNFQTWHDFISKVGTDLISEIACS